MGKIKKCLSFSMLFFLLAALVNLPAEEKQIQTDNITITDAEQLKGIWETLYLYQEIPRQKRIDTFLLTFPAKKEFESEEKYQERIKNLKTSRERRIEEQFKKEISNEQSFKNKQFLLRFSYGTPYLRAQDSAQQYDKVAYISNQTIDIKPEESYKYIERTKVLRRKIGVSTGTTTFFNIPISLPFSSEWKAEENTLSFQENITYFTFLLGEYNMETENFPVIFPHPQFTPEEKEWEYYTKKSVEGECYSGKFQESSTNKVEQWLMKFDEIPTCISLPLDKAKMVRKNEKDLILELLFRPVSATKKIGPGYIHYTLEIEFISATFKEGTEIVYAGKSGEWKEQEFATLVPEIINEAGWTSRPKYFDENPFDGLNDAGSPSNPWIVKPSNPRYGPTYEVSSKYDYGNDFASRRDRYYRALPAKVGLSLFPTIAYFRWSSVFADRWAYGITALGLANSNAFGTFFAPGQPANPYIARRVDDIEE